jgi:hypothetical protein
MQCVVNNFTIFIIQTKWGCFKSLLTLLMKNLVIFLQVTGTLWQLTIGINCKSFIFCSDNIVPAQLIILISAILMHLCWLWSILMIFLCHIICSITESFLRMNYFLVNWVIIMLLKIAYKQSLGFVHNIFLKIILGSLNYWVYLMKTVAFLMLMIGVILSKIFISEQFVLINFTQDNFIIRGDFSCRCFELMLKIIHILVSL